MLKKLYIICCFCLPSCAYLAYGQYQTILFKAVDYKTERIIDGVTCDIIDGRKNKLHMPLNPYEIKMVKGPEEIKITCIKEGYEITETKIYGDFDLMAAGNVAIWPGFLIDIGTHSYKRYPQYYLIKMKKIEQKEELESYL